jgi:hypothetical protein
MLGEPRLRSFDRHKSSDDRVDTARSCVGSAGVVTDRREPEPAPLRWTQRPNSPTRQEDADARLQGEPPVNGAPHEASFNGLVHPKVRIA